MGHGSYKASDWAKLRDSRGINASSGVEQIFSGNQLQDKYNPRFIEMRESCDSEDSPLSTPIILAFDVTGSMGYLAAEIAKNSLNRTILQLYDKQPVTNPHVLCAAITQPIPAGGLQVTQFEADIRVVEQLLELKVGFGGNRFSFDSLVWYFAARHTRIDCWDKRGKKGFLFVIGDEVCGAELGERLSAAQVQDVFGDQVSADLTPRALADMASERYEIFHIVTGNRPSLDDSRRTWEKFMPGRVALIPGRQISCLSEVITSILQLSSGMDREQVVSQWDGEVREVVRAAVADILRDPEPAAPQRPQPTAPVPPAPQIPQAAPKKSGFLARLIEKLTGK